MQSTCKCMSTSILEEMKGERLPITSSKGLWVLFDEHMAFHNHKSNICTFSFWNNRLLGLHKSQLRGAFDLESQSNDHEVTYLISLSFSCNYNVVRTSVMLYLKMKSNKLKKEDWKVCSKKSLGLRAPPFHTWKVFEKFRFHISSQNVLYSKLKLNTFSLLKLFVEFGQFLSGAMKVSNKLELLNCHLHK